MAIFTKVLIVDDEQLIRLNLRALLEDLGYSVIEAADGEEGVNAFDREHPDLVLADLRMPVMDGLAMIAALREKSPESPIIVISGAGTIREAVDSLRLGAWDYIMKPVMDAERLQFTIKRVLEKATLLRENLQYRENLERTAEALRRSEERYALAVEGANDVIWDVDLITCEIYHSKRLDKILGYQPDELDASSIGKLKELVHPDDLQRVMDKCKAYLERTIPSFELECRLRHKEGSYRWVECRGALVCDSGLRPNRMAGSLTDITERKTLEERVLQSQKLQSIAEFVRTNKRPPRGMASRALAARLIRTSFICSLSALTRIFSPVRFM